MTSTEVATALRPFYFAVHPDLFGQYPSQRTVNENSLKQLSSFLESLQNRKTALPCNLQFYIREKKEDKGSFRLVKLFLKEKDLREVILNVLKSCDLPTDFVDKIPKPIVKPRPIYSKINDIDLSDFDIDETIFEPTSMRRKMKEAQESLNLFDWINKNHADALSKIMLNQPIREENSRLRSKLIEKLKLFDLKWDCGWNETHIRGCLQSFESLSNQHIEHMYILKGRILVFAPFTGVSLDGHIMLNSGEVRHNWLDLIKNVRKYDAHLLKIPAFEKSVSQVLRDIKVVRRKFMPKILAGEYEKNLQQITTALSDYLSYKSFPKSWPSSFKNFEIVVETEAGPLMVSPTGQFIVPSSCPGSLLVSFLTDNLQDASNRIKKYQMVKNVETSLQLDCIKILKLMDLRKDDNVHPELMITCCENLINNKDKLNNLQGVYLNIATYYSVLSDGVVCIPWNWTT